MYTIVIGVPFRRADSQHCEVASDWGRALVLLRDSLQGRFGPVTVAAPEERPSAEFIGQQVPFRFHERDDGVSFVRLGWTHWRARHFWRHYLRIRRQLNDLAHRSTVMHTGINDIWQPYSLMGFHAGWRAGCTTVFVLDGDAIQRAADLSKGKGWVARTKNWLTCRLYSHLAKRAVAHADLAMLKGELLHRRYGRFARNPVDFVNTSYSAADVLTQEDLQRKCHALHRGATIRCVSLGRLVDYKGVDYTIRAVAQAAAGGARVELDIIGDGPDRDRLERIAQQVDRRGIVRFLGLRSYGPELLRELGGYHVLFFTSTAEETPRVLFDGMAGGCALLAFEIPFVQQVVGQWHHGCVASKGDWQQLASQLQSWDADRGALEGFMRQAVASAGENAVETLYRRRAEWTFEAHERRRGDRPLP